MVLRRVARLAPLALGLALAIPLMTDAAQAAPRTARGQSNDASVMPRTRSPAVVAEPQTKKRARDEAIGPTSGWTHTLLDAPFDDRRRRVPRTQIPAPFGDNLHPGEKFRFDVNFAGNPAGLAEAEIVADPPDARGKPPYGAPTLRILGHARTSGVVSILATVTDNIVSTIDARTGAAIHSTNTLHYDGFAPKYKHRVTEQSYEGRGQVRIVDTKDDKVKRKLKHVPVDTFDPMSAMAWVRNLPMEIGTKYKAHVVDGSTLMRIEIEALGPGVPKDLPSIARALELSKPTIMALKGKLTRVDEYDQPVPGKKAYGLRAWISNDVRRIPLVMESDMWVGAVRLELSAYDPPPALDDRPTSRDGSTTQAVSSATSEPPPAH